MWTKLLWLKIELEPEELSELLRHLALLAAFSTLLLSKSRHFQPTPVQTIDKTMNTVNRCEEVRKKGCGKREHETLLVSLLPSFLLVIIGYNKSIVS